MDTVVREVNESLFKILSDLESRRLASQNNLEIVNTKINEKVDEAKEYKVEVDNAKSKIKVLEQEIEALEVDLTDLNERFGKKDLNVIVEAGNREINSKIMEKQNQITKHRQKIGELTERARSIKELLINLKKDKTSKEEKLDIFTKAYDYYNDALNKIIEFAKNNPDSVNTYGISYKSLNYDYPNEPLTEVFDEIESMDKKDSNDDEDESNNIFEKSRKKSLDFEEINKSIDEEYNNIFGNNEDLSFNEKISPEAADLLNISEAELNMALGKSPDNILDNPDNLEKTKLPDIFGNSQETDEEVSSEIADFFIKYNLDFNQFTSEDQEVIKNIFTKDHFQKIMEILKDNQLDLNKIFGAVKLLEKVTPEELDQIITKLLLAGQTKHNIELVLDNLGRITSDHLTEVINSYGLNIKDANITELIMKTQKSTGNLDVTKEPEYLSAFDFTKEEITSMGANINRDIWEIIVNFPQIISENYEYLKNIGIGNIKEVFTNHPQMFIMNPDQFKAIFTKYDQADLIRCIEKNASVIEKL